MAITTLEAPVSTDPVLPGKTVGTYVPEHSRLEQLIALAVCLVSFLYLLLFRRYTWVDPDEGIILQGAQRILDGQVLYRDFFSFFTPGSYYLFALVFRIFGSSYVVAHTVLAVIGAGYSPITYLLARRVCGRQCSLLVTGLMTATALPYRFIVIHNWDSTLWACLALYCAVRLLESPRNKWAFAAASFASLTTLTEQSKGAGLVIGLGTGFLLILFRGQRSNLFTRGQLISIAAGFAWPFIGTFCYFAWHHAFTAMLAGWIWPLQHYSAANRVPYGYLDLRDEARHLIFDTGALGERIAKILTFSPALWIPFVPLFAVALLIHLVYRILRGKTASPDLGYYLLISSSITFLMLFSVVLVRADHMHFIHLQPIFFLVIAWMLDGRNVRAPLFAKVAPVIGFCIAISLMALGAGLLFRAHTDHVIVTRRGTVSVNSEEAVQHEPAEVEYIQSHVAPGERILVYPYETLYYYLSATYSPTRYEYYQPGMHTRKQQQEILTELSAHPVRVVVYDPYFADHALVPWPNTPISELLNDPVGDYIMREYRLCAGLPSAPPSAFVRKVWFMVRKDSVCP